MPCDQEALLFQFLDCLSQGGTGDIKYLGQIPLSGQSLARPQDAIEYQVFELMHDGLRDLR